MAGDSNIRRHGEDVQSARIREVLRQVDQQEQEIDRRLRAIDRRREEIAPALRRAGFIC